MSTVGTNAVTLYDLLRRLDPDGSIAKISEIMNEKNEIVKDPVWVECNQGDHHITTCRTGISLPAWRKLNQGVPQGKSETAQIEDSCGTMETYGEIDYKLINYNSNKEAFVISENRPKIEGLTQTFATTMFYGDTDIYRERFLGLTPRFNTPSADKKKIGSQIIDGGGTGSDNTSVWIVGWGLDSVHCIYPKGSKAGIVYEPLGKTTKEDSTGMHEVYRTHYVWDVGLTIRDWRHVVRICNIDVSALALAGDNDNYVGAPLVNLLIKGVRRVRKGGKNVIYCTESVLTALDLIANNKSTLALKVTEVEGQPLVSFRTFPIRECEALLETEEQVTGTFRAL